MPTKLLWRLLIGMIILIIAGGCSSLFEDKRSGDYAVASTNPPTFSLLIGGNELTESSDRQLGDSYHKGITIRELLKDSGIVQFAQDGNSILSVSNVSLGPGLDWELQVDSKIINAADFNSSIDKDAHLVITAKSETGEDSLQSVILIVNGGSEQAQLTHSYVMLFTEDVSVRSLLKGSGIVQLAENNRTVVSVKAYTPLTSEIWKLKVNGKQLLDSGMDMKLRPQDELEIALTSR